MVGNLPTWLLVGASALAASFALAVYKKFEGEAATHVAALIKRRCAQILTPLRNLFPYLNPSARLARDAVENVKRREAWRAAWLGERFRHGTVERIAQRISDEIDADYKAERWQKFLEAQTHSAAQYPGNSGGSAI